MQRVPLTVAVLSLLLWSSTGETAAFGRLRSSRKAADSEDEAAASATETGGPKYVTWLGMKDEPPEDVMFSEADDVANYLEKRRTVELVPEGARAGVDVTEDEQKEMESIFSEGERPNIFKNCMLIRDFATPLRRGSALAVNRRASLRAKSGTGGLDEDSADNEDSKADDDDDDDSTDDDDQDKKPPTPPPPPGDVLVAKGGIVDRDEAPVGKDGQDKAFMRVEMVAQLSSITGMVSVVPKGLVAKWGSKKKVPVAGYLCTENQDTVLYTLPTPCLPTGLSDDGVPAQPPPPAGASFNATPEARYAVYVGNTKLHFTSKRKAQHFCHKIAKEIAEDPGDNEWDADKLKVLTDGEKRNMNATTFVQLTRAEPPEAWTTGTKKVLVIVMDWMAGDRSRAPLSKQTLLPEEQRDRIFPRVKEAFKQMSFGKFQIEVDVVPEVIRFTRPRSRYVADGWPFPGLYNGAVSSLAGHPLGNKYDASKYDLVYTISPQQQPTGTKGVAWVGAKGAMCNGCEAISENFQVMVAVHELGHNLGLSHAGSTSLEYGNPFDWMGNYPDVQGLSYGMGYKLKLHWLPRPTVYRIDDNEIQNLNDRFIMTPFDMDAPQSGQIMGVQLSLKKNKKDLYFSYRKTPGKNAGVFVVRQDKESPDSELIDMACHTPSQQDASLQPGWTFIDPSTQVVVVVEKVTDESATIHFYKAPSTSDVAAIRARDTFSDGVFKCPRTCTDSDLLLSSYDGCAALANDNRCASASITLGGKKYSIGTDLCPKSCKSCAAALSGSTIVGKADSDTGGCADKNVMINGMSCSVIAAKGHCNSNTNIGPVGEALCPASCGNCPAKPKFKSSSAAGTFKDPTPVRTHGLVGQPSAPIPTEQPEAAAPPGIAPHPDAGDDEEKEECEDDEAWKDQDGHGCQTYREYISQGKLSQKEACQYGDGAATDKCRKTCGACPSQYAPHGRAVQCEDSTEWRDKDGDSCKTYAEYIKGGQLSREFACKYGGGEAAENCKKTCETCPAAQLPQAIQDDTASCKDKQCVEEWKRTTGQCFECAQWPSRCNETAFRNDCPKTCGLCAPDGLSTESADAALDANLEGEQEEELAEENSDCKDDECVESWLESTGKCFHCEEFAAEYCGVDDAFRASCPKSCRMCSTKPIKCHDDFKLSTCKEYKAWGWCEEKDVSTHCKATCGLCPAIKEAHKKKKHTTETPSTTKPKSGTARRGSPTMLVALIAASAAALLCGSGR